MSRKDDNNTMISKIRLIFSILLLLTVFLVAFQRCQSPIEEISIPTEGLAILPNSELATLISFSTLKDGSFDNILDNASSISIKFPVSVLANGQSLAIESLDDFSRLEGIFEEERYVRDSIELVYPVTAILSDYSELIIESKQSLLDIVASSEEGGADDDIECVSFIYPIQVSSYDQLNQLATVKSIEGDQELFQLFNQLDQQEITSFSYPIALTSSDFENININSNDELQSLLSSLSNDCDEEDEKYFKESDFSYNTSRLNIHLTDAPFPSDLVAEANVKISKLEFKPTDESEEFFILLSEEEGIFNLVDLTNGLTESLVGMQIPEGSYDQVRMLITEASVVLKDGEVFNLTIPSGQESGLKIFLKSPLQIIEGQEANLLLDFDVSRSFKAQGNPNTAAGITGFKFNPVIKASNLDETGTLEGNIRDHSNSSMITGAQISIYAADTLNTTTFSNENGEFTVLGLLPGKYDIIAEHTDYESETKENIEIEEGEETEVNFELTPN